MSKSRPGPAGTRAAAGGFVPSLLQRSSVRGAPAALRSLQRKLTIGASDDPLELEAERVADQVLAQPVPNARTAPRIQRLATASGAQGMAAPESVERVLAGAGDQLDTAMRADMEQRFGHDFSRVRPLNAKGFALVLPPPDVPKTLLRPVGPGGTLAPYSVAINGVGVAGQAGAIKRHEAELVGKTGAEKTRLEDLIGKGGKTLNSMLIQETMFNRFDPMIEAEVAAANANHGLTGTDKLDPDLVKSMIYQESQMGTAGKYMEMAPSNPTDSVMTRFNLGQVIDSSGMALYTMLVREQPAVITTYALGSLRKDLWAAMAAGRAERKILESKAKRNAAETARLAELVKLDKRNWEGFIWNYRAPGKTAGFVDAVQAYFAMSKPAKNVDYRFWIHMLVMWLFEKKTKKGSWLDAIKAYNGSAAYRKAVEERATGATDAAAKGKSYFPHR